VADSAVFKLSISFYSTILFPLCLCSLKKSLVVLADEKIGSPLLYDLIEVYLFMLLVVYCFLLQQI